MPLSDFVILNKIGEGTYSSVHSVKRKSDGKEYALKKVKMGNLKEKEKENALNEVRILASIDHPNIISYKDTFFDENSESLCIIMEYAMSGDLQKKIDQAIKLRQSISEQEIWKIFAHTLAGLKMLHARNILHRDLKCANIFIDKNGQYKLGDLNVSKVAKKGLVYTQTGTPYYASPEVWRDEPYDIKSDIWSLGCIIYETAALHPPFRAKDMEGLYHKVQKGVCDRIPSRYSNDLWKVIQYCLQVNSQQRPSCKQLLSNDIVLKNIVKNVYNSQQQLNQEQQEENGNIFEDSDKLDLLQTIKLPKNLKRLKENLPKPKYEKIQKNLNNSVDIESNQDKKLISINNEYSGNINNNITHRIGSSKLQNNSSKIISDKIRINSNDNQYKQHIPIIYNYEGNDYGANDNKNMNNIVPYYQQQRQFKEDDHLPIINQNIRVKNNGQYKNLNIQDGQVSNANNINYGNNNNNQNFHYIEQAKSQLQNQIIKKAIQVDNQINRQQYSSIDRDLSDNLTVKQQRLLGYQNVAKQKIYENEQKQKQIRNISADPQFRKQLQNSDQVYSPKISIIDKNANISSKNNNQIINNSQPNVNYSKISQQYLKQLHGVQDNHVRSISSINKQQQQYYIQRPVWWG